MSLALLSHFRGHLNVSSDGDKSFACPECGYRELDVSCVEVVSREETAHQGTYLTMVGEHIHIGQKPKNLEPLRNCVRISFSCLECLENTLLEFAWDEDKAFLGSRKNLS